MISIIKDNRKRENTSQSKLVFSTICIVFDYRNYGIVQLFYIVLKIYQKARAMN